MNKHDDEGLIVADDGEPVGLLERETPAEPQPSWLAPGEQSDHYLNLADAMIVGTRSVLDCQENLADTIEVHGMAVMHGPAGTGKSLAVNAALRELAPTNTVRTVFRARPTIRDIRLSLFEALEIPGRRPHIPHDFDTLLKRTLAEPFRVIVCDEAQWLPNQCLQYWRYLWDDLGTQISVVFVGGDGCRQRLHSEPALWSRIYAAQKFLKMDTEEVLDVIPLFHPVWKAATLQQIADVDGQACHGNFRNWALITNRLLQALRRRAAHSSPDTEDADDADALDPELLAWVLRQSAKS